MSQQTPVAWAVWIKGELGPRLVYLSFYAAREAILRWNVAYKDALIVPLVTMQEEKENHNETL